LSFVDEAIADEKTILQSLQQTLGQTQIYTNKIDAELKAKHADLIDFQVEIKYSSLFPKSNLCSFVSS